MSFAFLETLKCYYGYISNTSREAAIRGRGPKFYGFINISKKQTPAPLPFLDCLVACVKNAGFRLN